MLETDSDSQSPNSFKENKQNSKVPTDSGRISAVQQPALNTAEIQTQLYRSPAGTLEESHTIRTTVKINM